MMRLFGLLRTTTGAGSGERGVESRVLVDEHVRRVRWVMRANRVDAAVRPWSRNGLMNYLIAKKPKHPLPRLDLFEDRAPYTGRNERLA
jgi:hypothetical protein